MKLIKANIENFKDIEAKEVNFGGRSAVIIGRNATGKSSFLQAIQSPMNGNVVPLKPVREGASSAKVELELEGEDKRYTIEMHFYPDKKKGSVVLYDGSGQKLSRQRSEVEHLIGAISFDPFDFARKGLTASGTVSKAGVREQIETLMSFLSEEEKSTISEADHAISDLKEKKQYNNKRIKELEYEVKDVDIDKDLERKDEGPVQERIQKIDKEIENYDHVARKTEELKERKKELQDVFQDEIEKASEHFQEALNAISEMNGSSIGSSDLRQDLIDLKDKLVQEGDEDSINEKIRKGEKWLQEREKPSAEKLYQELEEIREHNRKVDEAERIRKKHEEVRELKNELSSLEEQIKGKEQEKKQVFASGNLPVEGLTFDEEQVLYNGMPFNESQLPSSDIIRVGIAIATGLDKNLRLITIKDGSLLDDEAMKELVKQVENSDHQVLIEKVGDNEELEVRFTESEL